MASQSWQLYEGNSFPVKQQWQDSYYTLNWLILSVLSDCPCSVTSPNIVTNLKVLNIYSGLLEVQTGNAQLECEKREI